MLVLFCVLFAFFWRGGILNFPKQPTYSAKNRCKGKLMTANIKPTFHVSVTDNRLFQMNDKL